MADKPSLLLHTCCGTCGAWIPEMLSADYAVTLFYFNPNVHPEAEYRTRRDNARSVAERLGVAFVEGDYDPRAWFEAVRGLEQEPENGPRCPVCFEHRLRATAKYASENGFDWFSTTLTVGRHKKAELINPIGEKLSQEFGVHFLARDFKKQGGAEQSVQRSVAFGIHRQDYCGCVFSRKESFLRRQGWNESGKKV